MTSKIPTNQPSFEQIAKQMRINADILMEEMSQHIEKLKEEIKNASNSHRTNSNHQK